MYHIVQGIPLNLPNIIMHQMREASARNKACLLYGMALTRLFEAAKILVKNEAFTRLSRFDMYDEKALTRMQFHIEVGRWVKNESGQKRKEPRVEETGEPSTPIASRAPFDYSSLSRATLDLLSPATPPARPPTASAPQLAAADSATLERLADFILTRLSA